MEIAPINYVSVNIGTPTSVRAPASLATAELAKGSSAVTSAMWMIRFVSKRRPRGVIPPIGIFGSRRSRRSSNARGAPCIATIRNSPPWTSARLAKLASQMRVAFARIEAKTRSSSPGELEMTCNTSAVAVCQPHYAGDRDAVADEIKRKLLVKCRVDGVVRADEGDRVAIGRRVERGLHADVAGRAGPVLNDKLLSQMIRQVLADDARHDVVGAARRKRDDPVHRARRIVCAQAKRDAAGSAAAPAARCKNLRRGSFILNLPSHHSIT